jgi:peptidoglycan/xylan/chitin deacetylase (PgdA/CDA1 family)
MGPVKLPILAYHAVLPLNGGERPRGAVALADFERHVDTLARKGFTGVSLDQAVELLEGRGEPVRRPVAITFDDGYRCVLEHALPVLERAGFPATLFVVTTSVGGTSHWYAAQGGIPLEHAGWDDLAAAVGRGHAVGSHTASHERLTELSNGRMEEELLSSRDEIAERLGRCPHFAYLFGAVDERAAVRVAGCGFRTASTTRPGFNRVGQPLLHLRRQEVSRTTGPGRFRRRVGLWW